MFIGGILLVVEGDAGSWMTYHAGWFLLYYSWTPLILGMSAALIRDIDLRGKLRSLDLLGTWNVLISLGWIVFELAGEPDPGLLMIFLGYGPIWGMSLILLLTWRSASREKRSLERSDSDVG